MENRKKVITAHNYERKGYISDKKGLTVPGQTLPLRTVLDRYRRGQSVQSFNPVYNPDIPPGFENMDKIERIEAARAQAANVARMRQALAAKQKREKAAQASVLPLEAPPLQQ